MNTPQSAGGSASNFGYVLIISLVATLGGFLFGYDSGVINGTVDGLQTAFNSDSVGTGFSVASMLLGSAFGAFFAGRLADMYGRRTMLFVAAILFIISAFGSGIANDSLSFIIYRIIGGLAVGAASVMAPAYISEVAPAKIRGGLASIQQIAIVVGIFMAFVVNYLLANASGSALNEFWMGYETWRWMFWMELIPAFVFLFALFFIPESPRYLMVKEKDEQSFKVLSKLFNPERAKEKVAEIRASLANDHKPKLSDLLKPGGGIRKIVWIGIGLAVFQQLVGINVIFYYGAVLWQAVGFSESDALLINVLSAGLSIVAVLITLATIDRIGRKPFLMIGSIGMAITLGIMAVAFLQAEVVTVDGADKVVLPGNWGLYALLAANAYAFLFNLSWGPVMWVMLGEMFPNQIRGSGLAVSGFAQWIANFGVTMTFPVFLATIGLGGAYGIYAFFAVLSVLFIAKMVHETKGTELEDMRDPGDA